MIAPSVLLAYPPAAAMVSRDQDEGSSRSGSSAVRRAGGVPAAQACGEQEWGYGMLADPAPRVRHRRPLRTSAELDAQYGLSLQGLLDGIVFT